MILKEIDKRETLNKFQKSGDKAEKQMAFYLKRAFQDSADTHVINDLRLVMNDDVAQIDHLVMHRFGFLIIESKSVTTEISINEHGEWARQYQKNTKGMQSPINQARRQADFLKKFLIARAENLLRKKLLFQASISDFKFDVLVAISDDGIINRAKNAPIDQVCKADQITDAANTLIAGYAEVNKNPFTLKSNYFFSDASMDKLSKFLIHSHQPQASRKRIVSTEDNSEGIQKPLKGNTRDIVDTPTDLSITAKSATCKNCHSENIEIRHGKYGYYFKCTDCDGNTSIKLKCKKESCKPRIRKDKLKFYQECQSCDTSVLYFENKAVEKEKLVALR